MRFLALLLLLSGCPEKSARDAVPSGTPDVDAGAFEPCTTLCLRPRDCEIAFNTDGICPPGFLCALTFSCVSDGGSSD